MAREDAFADPRGPDSPDSPHENSPAGTSALANPQDGHDLQQLFALARNPPPGASVYSPEAAVSSAVNPRSCVTCRKRKVRCDKRMPCSNCRRAKIPCIFPPPGRAPRRPRPKDPNAPRKPASSERELELMKRLRKLEGIVEELSGQIEPEGGRHSSAGASPDGAGTHDHEPAEGSAAASTSSAGGSLGKQSPVTSAGRLTCSQPPRVPPRGPPELNKHLGRLVLNETGGTRYVSSGFLSKINDELDDLKRETQQITDEESDESDVDNSPESAIYGDNTSSNHQSFILGYRSADVDLRPLHPLPSQIPFMWQTFQENVDPIVKILHVPTTDKMIRRARDDLDSLTPATEALIFSIYFAAITSLSEEDVKKNFGSEKEFLISQYRFALEQALAKANFITAHDLTVIQAFLLFLILVRHHDGTKFAWTMTGLITRMSSSIGLHRDGTNFPNLTPFEIEMRRRVFWHICVLDLRSAEDQGTDLTLVDRLFDTELPLNINDADISPESTELPIPRLGPTDLTFSLIRYEICILARRFHTASSAMATACPNDAARSLEEREAMLRETYNRVEHRYLKDADVADNPIYWVAANVARLIVAKVTLVIYQPMLLPDSLAEPLTKTTRDRIFQAATEIFEYNHLLSTDNRSKPWKWLLQTYTQWHAVAYVLIEVARRPWSSTVERAWAALNSVFTSQNPQELEKMAQHTGVWLPFRKLYLKARKYRESEIERLRADPEAARSLDLEERSKGAPTLSFGKLPGSVKNAVAHERWCKLVNAPKLSTDSFVPFFSRISSDSSATPSTTDQPAVTAVNEEELMSFVDQTMSARNTVMTDFLPAVWDMAKDASDTAQFGLYGFGGSADIPRVDNFAMENNATAAMSQPQAPASDNESRRQIEDNPGPWMWTDMMAQQPAQLPIAHTDDLDVTMDEGFSWQGFQEDLNKFEMASGGANAAGWAPGF